MGPRKIFKFLGHKKINLKKVKVLKLSLWK